MRRDRSAGRARPARSTRPPAPRPRREAPAAPAAPARVLARQPWTSLSPWLEACGADPAPTIERLRLYATALLEWNRGVSNLVSRHDEPRLVTRHLYESLQPAKWMKDTGVASFVDFGSGAGLPAIPLAIAGVGERWTLVESRRNKTLFLRKLVMDLGIGNVSVVTGRLEVLVDGELNGVAVDGFTSRATTSLGPTLQLAAQVLAHGGRAFLWKGSGLADEMAAAQRSWSARWAHESTQALGQGPNTFAVFRLL